MQLALIGNPNSGKTTLFNGLTGDNRTVGNWSGVTVGVAWGTFSYHGELWKIIDLPGLYSLQTTAPEQKVVNTFLLNATPDVILNVVNSGNLGRQLFLTTQLLELGVPVVVALNMADELSSQGIIVDEVRLSELLQVPCIKISALHEQGIAELLAAIAKTMQAVPVDVDKRPRKIRPIDRETRYQKVNQLVTEVVQQSDGKQDTGYLLDRWLCHPILGLPIFFLAMLLVFLFSFGPPGQALTTFVDLFCTRTVSPALHLFLLRIGVGPILREILVEGAFSGVVSVLVFLPQLAVLFCCLALLESSGYLARVAFLTDNLLSRFGLSGLSAIPLLLGCGCSVPGLTACRILDNPVQRRLTQAVLPFVSCSARTPVYALLTSVFFPRYAWLVLSGLFVLGFAMAVFWAYLFSRKQKSMPGIWLLELPPYRVPVLQSIWRNVTTRCWDFLSRAGTAVLVASIGIWILSHYGIDGYIVTDMQESLLATVGDGISIFLAPLGCADWRIAAALFTGVMAKEAVVSTLTVTGVYGPVWTELLTPLSALAFLVFVLLYTPCVATLITARRESGSWVFVLAMALRQLLVAWLVSVCIFQLGVLLGFGS